MLSSKNKVKVVCFYTRNTPYEQEVIHLKNSCTHFEIEIEIDSIKSQGSWEKNVAMKPGYILEKLESSDRPLLWVDADSVFLQKPDFSLFEGIDFSVRFMKVFESDPKHALNAATLFIGKTKEAKELVHSWALRTQELGNIPFVDQIALYDILLENKVAKILPLPVSYCKIFDIDTFFIDDEHVVIEQRQASRCYR